MCALKGRLSQLMIVLSAASSRSYAQELQFNVESLHQQMNLSAPERPSMLDEKVVTVGLKTPKLADRWEFTLLGTVDAIDNRQLYVHNRRGEWITVADLAGNVPEQRLGLKGTYYNGPITLNTALTQTENRSPRASREYNAEFLWGLFSGTSQLGLNVDELQAHVPEDYIINLDYQTVKLPVKVERTRVGSTFEQALSARLKTRIEVFYNDFHQTAPDDIGSTVVVGYAWRSDIYSSLTHHMDQQRRNEPLRYNTGYFDLTSDEVGLTIEPIYDLLVTATIAVQREREDDPRTAYHKQVDGIQYGIGIHYTYQNLTLALLAALTPVTGYKSNDFIGVHTTWKI